VKIQKSSVRNRNLFSGPPPQNENVPGVPVPPAEQKGDLRYGYP
jgi:hypothetical protein